MHKCSIVFSIFTKITNYKRQGDYIIRLNKNGESSVNSEETDCPEVINILLFSSKGAVSRKEITKVLLQRPQNCYQIAKQVNLEWWTVNKHLTILADKKLIAPSTIGKIKYYKINKKYEKIINIIINK
jgi:predicted transcriptional regulator